MSLSRFGKNIGFLTVSQLVARVIGTAWGIYLANKIGPTGLGKLATIGSFTSILGYFCDMGLGYLMIREISQHRDQYPNLMGSLIFLRICLSIITVTGMMLLIWALGYDHEVIYLTAISGIGMVSNSTLQTAAILYQGFEEMRPLAIADVLVSLSNAALGFGALQIGLGLYGVMGASVLCGALVFCMMWFYLLRRYELPRFELSAERIHEMVRLLRMAFPLGASALLALVYYRADKIMISKMVTLEAVGWYSISVGLIFVVVEVVSSPFMSTVYPLYARLASRDLKDLFWVTRKSLLISMSITVPLATGGIVVADSVILLLYGKEYSPSIMVMHFVLPSAVLICMWAILYRVLLVMGREDLYLKASVIACILNVGLNYVLISKIGYMGAAYAMVGTYVFLCTYCLSWLYWKYGVWLLDGIGLLKIGAGCAIMFLATLAGSVRLSVFPTIGISILIYSLVILSLGLFTRRDWAIARAILQT